MNVLYQCVITFDGRVQMVGENGEWQNMIRTEEE
jgi:hypothetical protein